MRTEIFIENYRLDLKEDISSEFTYAIDDIKDFASRNTSYSKTIIISGNATNNKLFGHIFEFGRNTTYNNQSANVASNFNASKSASCLVFIDKIQIFKGVIRLLEIVIDDGIEYECAVFGELGGFSSSLGNKYIEDLNFSSYNHAWTTSNITSSWSYGGTNNTSVAGSGYYYPLIDYGNVSTLKVDYDFRTFRPALYVKEYIDKIISGAGYTYECDFFNTDLFKRLIIPNNQKTLNVITDNALSGNATLKTYTGSGTTIPLEFGVNQSLGYFTSSAVNTIFTYTGTTAVIGTIDVSIFIYLPTVVQAKLVAYKNGIEIGNVYIGQGGTYGGVIVRYTKSLSIPNVTIATNDYISIAVVLYSSVSYSVQIADGSIKVTNSVAQSQPLAYGETIQMNALIPRGIFQRDFFVSIVKMFNLYITESTSKSKHLVIKPFIDFYTTSTILYKIDDVDFLLLDASTDVLIASLGSDTIDWTYKLDRSKPIRLKPMSELNGRYFEFKYKADTDYLNDQYQKKFSEGYADRTEDIGYEFSSDKQTAEIIFSPTIIKGYAGCDKYVPTIYKLNNNVEEGTEHNIRIMQSKLITGVNSWSIMNGATALQSGITSYGYAGHLNDPVTPTSDINFGAPRELSFTLNNPYPTANLFNGYWSDYLYEVSDPDSKLLTCNIKLTDRDIYNLDFSKLILIDGSLWRINKINNYNPMNMDTTQCELVKIIDLNGI